MAGQHHVIQAGTRSQMLLVHAADPAGAGPGTIGLRADSPGASAAWLRAGEAVVRDLRLVAGSVGVYSPGGFVEIDPERLPGVYQLGLPDELLATGAGHAVLHLALPGALVAPIDIALVAFDPQDDDRIGMRCLEWEERWSFLRQALPRLAELELALQAETAGSAQ